MKDSITLLRYLNVMNMVLLVDRFLENIFPGCTIGISPKGNNLLPLQANSSLSDETKKLIFLTSWGKIIIFYQIST